MGWFWSDNKEQAKPAAAPAAAKPQHSFEGDISLCPVMNPGGGPMEAAPTTPAAPQKDAATSPHSYEGDISLCPVMNPGGSGVAGDGAKEGSGMNPLNFIPQNLSATEQHPEQTMELTKERSISTIPKGNEDAKWEYPSAQQMYNAMVRKGKIDSSEVGPEAVDAAAVESMVEVHNFLNESCWYEVLDWEKPFTAETHVEPKLLRFMGKPGVLSPRARMQYYLSYILPGHFQRELPFDRHDWVILRGDPSSTDKEYPGYRRVRYVLDFYGGPDDERGYPTFSVDVRPALDNVGNARDRFNHLTGNIRKKYFPEEGKK